MTVREHAIWLNIWHWYTLKGENQFYRTALFGTGDNYHGIIFDKFNPNPSREIKLIGYTSDSAVLQVPQGVKISGKRKSIKVKTFPRLIGSAQHGKSTVVTKPSKIKIIMEGVKCCYCEVDLTVFTYTDDHLIPYSKGGKTYNSVNLRPCCIRCNREKDNLTLQEYAAFLSSVPQNNRVKTALKNISELEKLFI